MSSIPTPLAHNYSWYCIWMHKLYFLQRQMYINYKLSAITPAPKNSWVCTYMSTNPSCRRSNTHSRSISLTHMPGFQRPCRGMKSISKCQNRKTSRFRFIMHRCTQRHARAAAPAVISQKWSEKTGKTWRRVNKGRSSAGQPNSSHFKICCPQRILLADFLFRRHWYLNVWLSLR